jgi:hypothetical protein
MCFSQDSGCKGVFGFPDSGAHQAGFWIGDTSLCLDSTTSNGMISIHESNFYRHIDAGN